MKLTKVSLPFKACSEDRTLDSFHLTKEHRVPGVTLFKKRLTEQARGTGYDRNLDRLENYSLRGPVRRPVIPVLLLDDVVFISS